MILLWETSAHNIWIQFWACFDVAGSDMTALNAFLNHNAYAAACMALRFDAGDDALSTTDFPPGSWDSSAQHEQLQVGFILYDIAIHFTPVRHEQQN